MKTQKHTILKFLSIVTIICFTQTLWAAREITEKNITQAVEDELVFNASTPSFLIDVKTIKGIVTLSGTVDNILARDRAVKIAGTVKGVRGVVNQIEVDAPDVSNTQLESDITAAYIKDPATESWEIAVSANNGMVTLNGEVDSWQEKQLAEFVAKSVVGVKDIDNQLNIEYDIDRSDFDLKNDIEQALKNDIRIDDGLVNIKVKNADVELSGAVGSMSEKRIARNIAWTYGVNSVDDDGLKVQDWSRSKNFRKDKYVQRSDMAVKDAVKDALLYDPRVFSFNPEVSVTNGVVTLSGKVDNLKAKYAAGQDAKNVVGVYRVKNYLKVRPVNIPEDNALESDIESSLMKNPIIENWEVDVIANNGIVYLNGAVDSYFEKHQAEDIATKTKGVIQVENNLTVYDNNDYLFYDYYGWNTVHPPYLIDVENSFKTDTEIKDDIESQLWWSPYVNEYQVRVKVDDGQATLNGTVDTKREKLFAEINALEGGAIKVNNKLTVEYTP